MAVAGMGAEHRAAPSHAGLGAGPGASRGEQGFPNCLQEGGFTQ